MFGGKDPQRFFEGTDFTVTRVLYEAPLLVFVPSVYVDEPTRRWAVRLHGATPRIYSYEDVLACEVVDDDGSQARGESKRKGGLAELVANPALVARANAGKRGDRCFALGVVMAVRGSEAHIQLPLITKATPKSSPLYQGLRAEADQIKEAFDAMRA